MYICLSNYLCTETKLSNVTLPYPFPKNFFLARLEQVILVLGGTSDQMGDLTVQITRRPTGMMTDHDHPLYYIL